MAGLGIRNEFPRGSAVVEHRTHNPGDAGSIPAPATTLPPSPHSKRFGLTRRQYHLFQAIGEFIRTHKISPTVRELSALTALNSVGRTVEMLDALEERGLITRIKRQSRSIAIVRRTHACSACGHVDEVRE